MGTRHHRYVLLGYVDAYAQTLRVDVREVMLCLLRILVGHVEIYMVEGMLLHLIVYGTRHDVTRSQTQTLVVFVHKLLAVWQTEYSSVTAHCLRDEIGRMVLLRIVERRRMELHKLHVLHLSLRTIYHSNAVTCSDGRVGGSLVDGTRSACGNNCHLRQICVNLFRFRIQDVCTVALNVGSAACHSHSKMMLCDYLHGKVVFQHFDIRMVAHSLHQSALYLRPCVVGMVQDAKLRMSAFAVQVELSRLVAVEIHTPVHKFHNLLRRIAHHLLHSFAIAYPVARNHGVLNMLVEIVNKHVRH